jgi:glycosyltransferase involved in cell wall biosynthesis
MNTRSWKITAPLRALMRLINKIQIYLRFIITLCAHPKEVLRLLARASQIIKRDGLAGIRQAINNKLPGTYQTSTSNYLTWISLAEPKQEDYSHLAQIADLWKTQTTISVVMPTFNSNLPFLKAAIQSVKDQVYTHWELCIADDASTDPQIQQYLRSEQATDSRIKILFREKNGHISAASNSALTLASGQFIALLDHDDVLHPLALWHIAKSINENPDVGILYSDEDKLSQAGERCNPYFKCDFNPELMLAHNMISHLGCYRKSLIDLVGGFREDFVGSQDYDLALRIIDHIPTSQIIHIPHVLYHWRITPESTALNLNTKSYAQSAAIRAISEHISRKGLSGKVTPCPEMPHIGYRVQFDCPIPHPKVSIIIPTKDKAKLLANCIDSILEKTSYSNYEIIVMDNGSSESSSFELFERLKKQGITIVRDESPFNYSALNNKAAKLSQGQFICLMNNDIEVITPGWLEEMVSFASQTDVGAVGARLWYPNDTIQHAGVIVGLGGVAGHAFVNLKRGEPGYFGRAIVHQSYSAVTAACLVVRKSVFEQVEGLDESLAIAFNDVDFCLRVRAVGYRNVWTPYAQMYHHESASRGTEDTPAKKARFEQECALIRTRWADITAYDPTYSPNLALGTHHFEMAFPPRTSLT